MVRLVEKVGKALVSAFEGLHPYNHVYLDNSRYSFFDLLDLDKRYKRMHRAHYDVHSGIIKHLGKKCYKTVLEVACGTGWNIPLFQEAGLDYYGLDISETALAVAILKYPEHRYFNLSIADAFMLRDNAVDVVYSSSMLEHIGFYEEAINAMVRVARHEAYILFFEGLSSNEQNTIKFHAYTQSEISGEVKDMFGRKIVLQDHIHNREKGWYWNRYSKHQIVSLMEKHCYQYRILDSTTANFIDKESVLVIIK